MFKITSGILFEESGIFLPWGEPIENIVRLTGATVEDRGDRTLYIFGRHKILNGLEMGLATLFWNTTDELDNRKFYKIECDAVGDQSAIDCYSAISAHMLKKFGEPFERDESNPPEKSLTWKFENVSIRISVFEMHCLRASFRIEYKK